LLYGITRLVKQQNGTNQEIRKQDETGNYCSVIFYATFELC
jgi:hypothetical protein